MSQLSYSKEMWGVSVVWASTNEYSSRVLYIEENQSLPHLYHKRQDITLFVLEGRVLLLVEGKKKVLEKGDTYHLPPLVMHKVSAFQGEAIILEAGTKIEDDIVFVER